MLSTSPRIWFKKNYKLELTKFEKYSTFYLLRDETCILVAFCTATVELGLQYTVMARCVRIIHEDVNFSRWGGVCKTRGPRVVLPGMILNPCIVEEYMGPHTLSKLFIWGSFYGSGIRFLSYPTPFLGGACL